MDKLGIQVHQLEQEKKEHTIALREAAQVKNRLNELQMELEASKKDADTMMTHMNVRHKQELEAARLEAAAAKQAVEELKGGDAAASEREMKALLESDAAREGMQFAQEEAAHALKRVAEVEEELRLLKEARDTEQIHSDELRFAREETALAFGRLRGVTDELEAAKSENQVRLERMRSQHEEDLAFARGEAAHVYKKLQDAEDELRQVSASKREVESRLEECAYFEGEANRALERARGLEKQLASHQTDTDARLAQLSRSMEAESCLIFSRLQEAEAELSACRSDANAKSKALNEISASHVRAFTLMEAQGSLTPTGRLSNALYTPPTTPTAALKHQRSEWLRLQSSDTQSRVSSRASIGRPMSTPVSAQKDVTNMPTNWRYSSPGACYPHRVSPEAKLDTSTPPSTALVQVSAVLFLESTQCSSLLTSTGAG